MRKTKDTRFDLVEELRALPSTPGREQMIVDAVAGEFHDYKNKKYMCGKVELVNQLRKESLYSLAQRVIDGEFDERADADDLELLRRDIYENTPSKKEADAMIQLLGLETKDETNSQSDA